MIFALRQPAILLGLVAGFLIGAVLKATAQRAVVGTGRGRLRAVGGRRRPEGGWAAFLDPYGTVAAVLAGVGWSRRPDLPFGRRDAALRALIAGLAVHGALAAVAFTILLLIHGAPVSALAGLPDPTYVLHGSGPFGSVADQVLVAVAMVNLGCGLLTLVPIPPLELGVLLWSRLPRSAGARRMAYRLLEEQWGIAVVLLFLLLPLAGQQPVLLALLDTVGSAILRAF